MTRAIANRRSKSVAKKKIYDLGNIVNGEIQKIVDELQLVNNMEKLKEASGV